MLFAEWWEVMGGHRPPPRPEGMRGRRGSRIDMVA